ncbi:diaminobutyrate acetyltransferase [Chromobacterium phragmitis]|uniref:L-2,4-diaminobutyric acid acetyltransferase n=1 Tax=Chromobacterium phragmitis TaxID=2202141 RepID=A0A344UHU8_9NEIS|nr:diaminobutyrate acetyltransferase [Chromobacterium phragmitis]AXE34846.1 diaminobutyrate acetyltransferase [Chromobacterium phragmitis]
MDNQLILRAPAIEDGPRLFDLIQRSPPLELNSPYAYLLIADHFSATTVIAERGGRLIGCVTSYRRPDRPETLFIWQVAVAPGERGQGLAKQMLDALIRRRPPAWVETTISASNHASLRMFRTWAEQRRYPLQHAIGYAADLFGHQPHEEEVLYRFGPLIHQETTA